MNNLHNGLIIKYNKSLMLGHVWSNNIMPNSIVLQKLCKFIVKIFTYFGKMQLSDLVTSFMIE
jgi:hypothetical protein